MNNKRILLGLLTLALPMLMASCVKEFDELTPNLEEKTEYRNNEPMKKVSFVLEMEQPLDENTGVRTTLADDGLNVKWTKGDQVSVLDLDLSANVLRGNYRFTATSVNGSLATFEGEVPVSSSSNYTIVYPYDPSITYEHVQSGYYNLKIQLKTNQTAVLGGYADNTAVSVARANLDYRNNKFNFHSSTSLLKIQFSLDPSLAGKSIAEIRLISGLFHDHSSYLSQLSGKMSMLSHRLVMYDNDYYAPFSRRTLRSGRNYISLTKEGGIIEPTGDKAYYIVVPEQFFVNEQTYSLVFIASDGSAIEKRFTPSTPFSAGKIKSIKVHIDRLEHKTVTNVPLIDAAEKGSSIKFDRNPDGTMDYFKNLDRLLYTQFILADYNSNLSSLRDLEYFPALVDLNIRSLAPTGDLEISKNPRLKSINFNSQQNSLSINSVRLRNVDRLEKLYLSNIKDLGKVDVESSSLVQLHILNSTGLPAKVNSLNLSKLPALEHLELQNVVNFSTLDLTHNSKLTHLEIVNTTNQMPNTALEMIKLGNHPNLNSATIKGYPIKDLNFSQAPLLTEVVLSNLQSLKNLNLSSNSQLISLDMEDTSLSHLNLEGNAEMTNLRLINNPELLSIAFAQGSKLQNSYISMAEKLNSLAGIQHLTKLEELGLEYTAIQSLDPSVLPLLKALNITGSKIATIDISKNPLLLDGSNYSYFGSQDTANSRIYVRMRAAQARAWNQQKIDDPDSYEGYVGVNVQVVQ